MDDLRIVVIDDDRTRLDFIKNMMPGYIKVNEASSGEEALQYIKRDANGMLPDVILLDGDDRKSNGLYAFDWMVNRSGDEEIASIPVIVMTEDEFSDKSLEFFEIGDVMFYVGEVDELRLFSMITEAIEGAEFMLEEEEPSYEETKNIDRIIGQTVKASGGDGKQRSVVLDKATRLKNLEAAIERGQKKVRDYRELIETAQRLRGDADDDKFARKKHHHKEKTETSANPKKSFFSKVKEESDVKPPEKEKPAVKEKPADAERIAKDMQEEAGISKALAKKRLDANAGEDVAKTIGQLRQKAVSAPFQAFGAQGTKTFPEPKNVMRQTEIPQNDKRTILIVDSDIKTAKLLSLYLAQKYNVVTRDGGIKAIDYVVGHHIDLLIINPVLPDMSGIATVSSVRLQPGGSGVPVMYLVGDDYMEPRSRLLDPNVFGILNKPVKKDVLLQSVNGFFRVV